MTAPSDLASKLRAMGACPEAIEWVGTRTLRQAWNECERGDWMAWLTQKLRLDSRSAAADMAERVWHLVTPESQLACAWAIDCARRGADNDEMWAAVAAAGDAAGGAVDAAWAAWAAWAAAGASERKAHVNIMRRHFTWRDIERAMK
jgi:hypothetical protein